MVIATQIMLPFRLIRIQGRRIFGVVPILCIVLGCVVGCDHTETQGRADASQTEHAGQEKFSQVNLEVFDSLVTTENVFSDPLQQNLYQFDEPSVESERRTYAFHLKHQPGMVDGRHFQLVTITVVTMSELKNVDVHPSTTNTGGPNGSFLEVYGATSDRRYGIAVTEGMLLTKGVDVPAVDSKQILERLLRLYDRKLKEPLNN